MSKQRLSRQRWRELVDEQRASGLSVDAFCKRRGLATSTFFNWRRRFKSEPTSAVAQASADATFVELEAPPASPITKADASTPSTTSPIELVLSNGLVVRVRHGFDPRLLQQVVEALA